jgi:hypothetical protein
LWQVNWYFDPRARSSGRLHSEVEMRFIGRVQLINAVVHCRDVVVLILLSGPLLSMPPDGRTGEWEAAARPA